MTSTPAIDDRLRSIVGAEHARAANSDDSIAGVNASLVVSPGNEGEVAEVLACANEAGLAVVPRGGGTKLRWGNPPKRADVLLSLQRLDHVIEHAWADLTVAVEAGCTMKQLQETLSRHGQRVALDSLWPANATVGGVLSTNDSGVLRLRYGALRDLIIGVTIALPDGTLATSGGKVVKNVAGYDLPKLVTGALGTLGVITRAIFRTHPLSRECLTLTFPASDPESLQAKVLAIQNSQLAHTALQIRRPSLGSLEVDILFEGRAAGLQAQEKQLQALLGSPAAQTSDANPWSAREQLWNDAHADSVIAKVVVLPSMLAATFRNLERTEASSKFASTTVMQATGIGSIRLNGTASSLQAGVAAIREFSEANGGSLVVLHSTHAHGIECWGRPADALSLMRALKQQFDPKATLNPGRFVGGI